MKDLNRFLILGFLLVLIAGCSKMEIESDHLNSAPDNVLKGAKVQMVPFKSAFETWKVYEEMIFSGETPIGFHVVVEGSGEASHLGNTTMTVDQEWYFSMSGGPLTGTSMITMTAANGDMLKLECNGELYPNQDWSYLNIEGTCIIIPGSTGRFEDACVELDLAATYDNAAGGGETFMTGTIMY